MSPRPLILLALLAACAPAAAPITGVAPADSAAYVASVARAERKAARIRTHRSYDRISGRTTVSMPLLGHGAFSGGALRLVVSYAFDGDSTPVEPPDEVLFTVDWEDYGGSTRILEAPTAWFLVDDSVRFSSRGSAWEAYVDRSLLQIVFEDSTFRQRVVIPVAREDFALMTRARKVEARVDGAGSFALKPEHIAALRRLEDEMTPE